MPRLPRSPTDNGNEVRNIAYQDVLPCITSVSSLYYIMSIHEPLIHHKYAVIRQKYMYSMSSHMSCADTNPIHAQYVRYMHNTSSIRALPSDAVDTARYTIDTQPIRSRYAERKLILRSSARESARTCSQRQLRSQGQLKGKIRAAPEMASYMYAHVTISVLQYETFHPQNQAKRLCADRLLTLLNRGNPPLPWALRSPECQKT